MSKAQTEKELLTILDIKPGNFYTVIKENGQGQLNYCREPYYPNILRVGSIVTPIGTGTGPSTNHLMITFHQLTDKNCMISGLIDDGKKAARFTIASPAEKESFLSQINKVDIMSSLLSYHKLGAVGQSGADPELFILDKNKEVIPAWEVLPQKSRNLPIFWDGFQAEFTPAARGCHTELTGEFKKLIWQIAQQAHSKFPGSKLSWQSVVSVSSKTLEEADDKYVELGCAPSSNAYSDEPNLNLIGLNPRALPIRFAGCHLHFSGWLDWMRFQDLPDDRIKGLVKAIDAIAGVASVSIFRGMEDSIRRRYYGRAGEYRRPKHGLEYRVFSSAVLASPVLVNLMLDLARVSTNLELNGGMGWLGLKGYSEDRIQGIINECDVRGALQYIEENSNIYSNLLDLVYGRNVNAKKVAGSLIKEGAINCLDVSDMEKNWKIDGQGIWDDYEVGSNCSVLGARIRVKTGTMQKGA